MKIYENTCYIGEYARECPFESVHKIRFYVNYIMEAF